jgi:outer membrane protein OmpU
MKKVLLTTTALVMTAGVAAAEVTMSGTTQAAVSKTTDGDNVLSTHIDFNIAVSGASDNGITMSAGFGYDAGRQVDAADFELDAEEASASNGLDADATGTDADNNPAWATAAPSLTIGYAGYTITADGSGVADYYNGDIDSGELGVAGSMGDVAFGVTTSIGAASGESTSSYSLSYAMGDITLAVVGSDNADGELGVDATKATLTYKMGDTTFTASSDDKDGATIETVTSLGVSSKLSDTVTVSYTAKNTETLNSSIGDDWDASISYTAGALTASYATDEDSVSTISASYDLGGGANLFAAIRSGEDNGGTNGAARDRDFQAVGINFAF